MANVKSLEINGISIIDIFYPVGCLFYTTDNNFDPNSVFENTTWEKIEGRFIVGTSTSDSDFTSMKTGGEKNHTLTIAEMPSHGHTTAFSYLCSAVATNGGGAGWTHFTADATNNLTSNVGGDNLTTTYLHIIAQIFGIELLKSIESSFHKFNERRKLNWQKSKI